MFGLVSKAKYEELKNEKEYLQAEVERLTEKLTKFEEEKKKRSDNARRAAKMRTSNKKN